MGINYKLKKLVPLDQLQIQILRIIKIVPLVNHCLIACFSGED